MVGEEDEWETMGKQEEKEEVKNRTAASTAFGF